MKVIAVLMGIAVLALIVFVVAVLNLANSKDSSNDLTRASATPFPSRQLSSFGRAIPLTPRPSPTVLVTETPQAVSDAPELYGERLVACHSRPEGSTVKIVPTSRTAITLPRNDYVLDGPLFIPVSGHADGSYISNAGPWGRAYGFTSACWSTYFELGGEGQVDFRATSARPGIPDYVLHFLVGDYRPTPIASSR